MDRPVCHPLLVDILPELAQEMVGLLHADGLADLALQVPLLRIHGRCSCGELECSSFYTAPKPSGPWGPRHENVRLDAEQGLLVLDVVDGQIVHVEVLNRPDIRRQLEMAEGVA